MLSSCDSKRAIELHPSIKKITGGDDLKSWLVKAPFNGYWDPQLNGGMVITNVQEVFPFVGKFKDATNSLETQPHIENTNVYNQYTAVFKDRQWGETVFHAKLLYQPTELFVDSYYSTGANIAFTGIQNLNRRYTASLSETKVVRANKDYKTGIYWIRSNAETYLSGFYQKGQLAFQFAFPFKDTIKSLNKVKQINTELKLNIPEWNNLQPEDLEINVSPQSFWQDPYIGYYFKDFLPLLKLKLKDTDYQEVPAAKSKIQRVDFMYKKLQSATQFSISKSKEPLGKSDFDKQVKDYKILEDTNGHTIYILENTDEKIRAQAMLKDHYIVEFVATIDSVDNNAKEEILEILKTAKIQRF